LKFVLKGVSERVLGQVAHRARRRGTRSSCKEKGRRLYVGTWGTQKEITEDNPFRGRCLISIGEYFTISSTEEVLRKFRGKPFKSLNSCKHYNTSFF
jgi:hypothetical protein